MKSKQKKIVVIVLILAGMFSSCADKPVEPVPKDFCSCVNSKDFEQTIPFINEALSDLDDVRLLAAWLKSQPCIADALYFVNTGTNTCEFLISFEEDGITKKLILDVPTTIPLKTTGYREYDEEYIEYINSVYFDKIIPVINKWLSGLSDNLDDLQKLQELTSWLKARPEIFDATVLCFHCISSDSPMSLIAVSFVEDGTTKELILDVSITKPLKIAGYHGINEQKWHVYENHNILACGVNDPMQNIWWLREYYRRFNQQNDISNGNGFCSYNIVIELFANKYTYEEYIVIFCLPGGCEQCEPIDPVYWHHIYSCSGKRLCYDFGYPNQNEWNDFFHSGKNKSKGIIWFKLKI